MVNGNIDIVEAASVAAEAYFADQAIDVMQDMFNISIEYYDLYKNQQDFYNALFFDAPDGAIPSIIYETDNISLQTVDYPGRVSDFWSGTGAFSPETKFNGPTDSWMDRQLNRFSMSSYLPESIAMDYWFDADNAALESDWTNYMFRFEEMRTDVENDIRFQKKLQAMNLGIRQGNIVSSALHDSLDGYQDQLSNQMNQLATYANGLANYIGYRRSSKETAEKFDQSTQYRNNNPFAQSPTDMWAYQPSGQLT